MPHLVDKNDSKKLMKKSFYFQDATGAVRVIWGYQNSAVLKRIRLDACDKRTLATSGCSIYLLLQYFLTRKSANFDD